jgi:hypothetical protein
MNAEVTRAHTPHIAHRAHSKQHPTAAAASRYGALQRPPYQGVQRKDMHPIAPRRRPFRPHFMHLFRLALTRSRPAEPRKANHFLAHLALLAGPEALSRPATAQKSLAPPCAAALGHGNLLSGLKLSGERDGGLGLARFSVVCPLGGHMYANGL